jgi:choline dehydrogenase-like flavoprotein
MTRPRSAIIVGTGPAGVAAAWPLVEAGWLVTLIEAGCLPLAPPPEGRPSLADLRRGGAQADLLLGPRLGGLREMSAYSPKLRTMASPEFVDAYAPANRLEPRNFALVGTLAPGGLSNLWGAVCSSFDADDLGGDAALADDLKPSYRRVAARIGLSGSDGDDMAGYHGRDLPLQPPLPLGPCAQALSDAYGLRPPTAGFSLGRSRLAVRTVAEDGRGACIQDQMCMWGCAEGAIYNAATDLARLEARPNVTIERDVVVVAVARGGVVTGVRGGHPVSFAADRVLVAAGAFASARLALDFMGWFDREMPAANSPAFGFAAMIPDRLGHGLPKTGVGLSQLTVRHHLGGPSRNHCLALLYEAPAFAAPDIAAHLPFSRLGAAGFLRSLLPGLMLGLAYLPGEYSHNRVVLRRGSDGRSRLEVNGGLSPDFRPAVRAASAGLARGLRRAGAWLLPGSVSAYRPGAEVHYGAILPMGTVTSPLGELAGDSRIHVVDGSVLPRVPAKHHTFTLMANADRIARELARISG